MEKEIQVEIKNVYGNDLVYPVCKKAILFSKLTGKLTFNSADIKNIKALEYEVKVIAPCLAEF